MSLEESIAMYTTPKLPSDAYSKEFVNGKKGTIGNTVAFKAIPRSHALHLEDIKNTLAEKVDSGKYHPQHSSVENKIYRNWTIAQTQRQRRSIYFEGVPDVYMNGCQPNPEANPAHKYVHANPGTKEEDDQTPACSKATRKLCLGSIKRVQ